MKLSRPIPVLNVDGTSNVNGTITHYTWRSFTLGQKRLTARLLITSLGKEDVILGLHQEKDFRVDFYLPISGTGNGAVQLTF